MIEKLKQFFEHSLAPPALEVDQHMLNLAAASLLFEMMRMDDRIEDAEVAVLANTVKKQFQLSEAEVQTLLQLAEMESRQATDYFQFTSLINEHYTMAQKIQLIESLWRVAFADQHLDPHEEHMVRKISDLLYVAHSDFIATKLRVQNKMK